MRNYIILCAVIILISGHALKGQSFVDLERLPVLQEADLK